MKKFLTLLAVVAGVASASDAQAFGGRCRGIFGGRFASGGCGTASACQPQQQFVPQQQQFVPQQFAATAGCTNCGCQQNALPGFVNPVPPAQQVLPAQAMPAASAAPVMVEWAVPPSVTARSTVYLSGAAPVAAQPADPRVPTIQLSEPVPAFGRPLGRFSNAPVFGGGCAGGSCGQPAGFLFR